MSFREINHKNNEEYWERLELVMERIEAVSEEEASSVEELYRQTRHMPSVRWAGNTDRCSRHWMPDCMEFIPAVWKEISVICVFMRNCLWKFTTVLRMHRI